MYWHPCVVNNLGKATCGPLFPSFQRCKTKIVNWVAIVVRIIPVYHRVVAVDQYRLVIVRDEEGEDLAVKLILAVYEAEELDDCSYRKSHAVGVLAVRHVGCRGGAFDLARQEREVHVIRRHEGQVASQDVSKQGGELLELIGCECLSFKTHGVSSQVAGECPSARLNCSSLRWRS